MISFVINVIIPVFSRSLLRATHINGHIDALTSTHRPSIDVVVQSALSLSIKIYSVYCGCLSYLKSRETEEKKEK